MIYTVTMNPALDKTITVPDLSIDRVNRAVTVRQDPGGKGINVAKVLTKLGVPCLAVGFTGGPAGQAVQQMLRLQRVPFEFLEVAGSTRTNLKIVDPVRHTNTDINEPGFAVTPALLEELLQQLLRRLQPGDLVVLAGSLPQGAPADTYGAWVRRCREAGAKVFLDADGEPLRRALAAGPYLVKPNAAELERVAGRALPTEADRIGAARALFAQGVQKVVVSLGGEGALYLTPKENWRARAVPVPVGSTVGAGDSMVAALAAAEQCGAGLEQAIRLSMAAGAANVMSSGTQAAEKEQIESLMPRVKPERVGAENL